jgi:hypothetical protein
MSRRELTGMTPGMNPPMPDTDMLHKTQWEWPHQAQEEKSGAKPASAFFPPGD